MSEPKRGHRSGGSHEGPPGPFRQFSSTSSSVLPANRTSFRASAWFGSSPFRLARTCGARSMAADSGNQTHETIGVFEVTQYMVGSRSRQILRRGGTRSDPNDSGATLASRTYIFK